MNTISAGRPIGAGPAIVVFCLLASVSFAAQVPLPLDLLDATYRPVLVQVESSADLGIVGQSFGLEFPATYSASGNTGTLMISAETHEQMLAGNFAPVPGTFTPIVIEFDLTTFAATSQPASGAMASGPISESFTQNALSTSVPGGFMGPDVTSLFCTSQDQVDAVCQIASSFCGQTCTIVAGRPYDPATGSVNLVGSETQFGCDGSVCFGPFDHFTGRGDLLLTEAPAPPPSAGGGGGNPCLIATAAYGTPLADQLDGLREFRDARLLGNPVGAALTDAYYRLSPPIAEQISRDGRLRSFVRRALEPIVWMLRD